MLRVTLIALSLLLAARLTGLTAALGPTVDALQVAFLGFAIAAVVFFLVDPGEPPTSGDRPEVSRRWRNRSVAR